MIALWFNIFFFSSRRRHTRCLSDWSSDVCSSDLHNVALQEQQQQIAANKASIDAAVERFGQLDDYYILDEVTVYFGNGQVKVDPSYRPKLLALAEKAKTINGYVIDVKGHASSVGS